jgi:hypothetical protein
MSLHELLGAAEIDLRDAVEKQKILNQRIRDLESYITSLKSAIELQKLIYPQLEMKVTEPLAPIQPLEDPYTVERRYAMKRGWEAGDTLDQISTTLNNFPGPKLSDGAILQWIRDLGFKRAKSCQPRLKPPLAPIPVDPLEPAVKAQPSASEQSVALNTPAPAIIKSEKPKGYTVGSIKPFPPAPKVLSAPNPVYEPDLERMAWPEAMCWAKENKVVILEGSTHSTVRKTINDARIALGLPAWNIK